MREYVLVTLKKHCALAWIYDHLKVAKIYKNLMVTGFNGHAMVLVCLVVNICVVLQNHVDEAMEMYQELHKWDDAIVVAEAKVMA